MTEEGRSAEDGLQDAGPAGALTEVGSDERVPFNLGVFDQDRVWVDPRAGSHMIGDLDRAELQEILQFLRQHAAHFHVDVVRRDVVLRVVGEVTAHRGGEELAAEQGSPRTWEVNSQDWLASTVLVRGLERWLAIVDGSAEP